MCCGTANDDGFGPKSSLDEPLMPTHAYLKCKLEQGLVGAGRLHVQKCNVIVILRPNCYNARSNNPIVPDDLLANKAILPGRIMAGSS